MMSGGGHSCDVFDFSMAAARDLFIATCVNATQTGYVDGCFVDRAVDGTPVDSGDDNVPNPKKVHSQSDPKSDGPNMTAVIGTELNCRQRRRTRCR